MEAKVDDITTRVVRDSVSTSPQRVGETTTAPVASIGMLNVVRLLLLGLWLGAAMFFSFAVAPSAFAVLPARELAGAIVTRTIGIVRASSPPPTRIVATVSPREKR